MAGQLLDTRRTEPLWAQLSGILRQRLLGGEYSERFPTEMELTVEFAVSRATVREAIRRLRDEGLLRARRGSGTFVVHRELEAGLLGAPGLAYLIKAAGLVEESAVLRLEEGPAGEEAARRLGLAPTDMVVWVERLRTAEGNPIAMDRSAIALPAAERAAFLSAELKQGTIYAALEERCGVHASGAVEEIEAVMPTEAEAVLLSLRPGEGLLQIDLVSYSSAGAIEWRTSRVRGTAYVLSARWGDSPVPA